jgi:NitT/TauT family transport system substrate-binding protein
MHYINKDQSKIEALHLKKKATIVVTYSPYDIKLLKIGYKELASTKSSDTIIVIDALFATHEFSIKHKEKLVQLKAILDRSIKEIQENPKTVYFLTNKYLNNITYEEYENSLKMIQWINKPNKIILSQLKKINYSQDTLIK